MLEWKKIFETSATSIQNCLFYKVACFYVTQQSVYSRYNSKWCEIYKEKKKKKGNRNWWCFSFETSKKVPWK